MIVPNEIIMEAGIRAEYRRIFNFGISLFLLEVDCLSVVLKVNKPLVVDNDDDDVDVVCVTVFLAGNDPGDDDCVGLPVVCGSMFINRALQSLMILILEKTSLSHFIGLSRMSRTANPG
jgi:hypothetical protein